MPYRFDRFDDAKLPFIDPAPDLSSGQVESTLLDSVGGAFDYYGTRQRLPRRQMMSLDGVFMENTNFLVTHTGAYLVTHAGDYLIAGSGAAVIRTYLDKLTGKLGVRGTLWRQRLDDVSVEEWKTARLMQVRAPRDVKEVSQIVKVGVSFETLMVAWRSAAAITTSESMIAGLIALLPTVGGNTTIEDARITITASATITSINVVCTGAGVDWTWTGSLSSGQSLVIECGDATIRKAGADAYSGFTLNAGHSARGWLPMAPGLNVVHVTADNTGTFAIRHYDQWL